MASIIIIVNQALVYTLHMYVHVLIKYLIVLLRLNARKKVEIKKLQKYILARLDIVNQAYVIVVCTCAVGY